ncbi:spore coat U domain-containing protein [Alcaligenaceae bacterium CGII-47]|nr:spore coat U domain-containing protein [Alcaligenaceae bacterium CGII-47]
MLFDFSTYINYMKYFKNNVILAVSAFALIVASSVQAASPNPATGTFSVQITLESSCTVAAGPDINLGSQFQGAVDALGSSAFTVTCTKSTPYTIGMEPSNGDTAGAGVLIGTTSAVGVSYTLYQSNQTSVWGNVVGSNTVGGTGTGAPDNHTVYAKVMATEYTNEPDTYTDMVTISVGY